MTPMFAGFHRHEKEGPMRKLLTFPCVTKALGLSLFVVVIGAAAAAHAQDVSVYAVGLDGPRGMTFGPDGNLYVAEAGRGGPNTPCVVVPIVGPYHGGPTARVSMITSSGERVTVVDGLPSGMTSLPSGDTIGAAAVAFLGSKLFVLSAGGGCTHANPDNPPGIVRANLKKGTWSYIVDLGAFMATHPALNPNVADFEPEGTLFSMVEHHGHFYAVEPNHGQVFRVNPGGHAEELIDISATQGHVVPTVIVFHDGAFYVGTLSTFPIQPGSATVLKISERGELLAVMGGFTTVVGLAFDSKGRLYVEELSDAPGFPAPGAGKIVRVSESGAIEDFLTGLVVPTGLLYGPDGALYVSDFGAAPPGLGRILRVTIPD
jgi:hypothetical protein